MSADLPSVIEILRKTEAYLKEKGVPSPRFEAEQLIGHALGMKRMELYLQFDRPLSADELDRVRPVVARRGRREPLGWILGSVGFYLHDFVVRPGVLVPRPDTEALVDVALGFLPEGEALFVADIGAGTGCVGLSLALARPDVKVFEVDLSAEALANTRENVLHHDLVARVAVLQGSLLDPIPPARRIDLVVSNPPYIARPLLVTLQPEVRDHEPRLALDGGVDGLDVYRALLPAAAARATRGVVVEIGHDQAAAVRSLFEEVGLIDVLVRKDLAGHDRVVSGWKPGWSHPVEYASTAPSSPG